jgi:hypothetical protein
MEEGDHSANSSCPQLLQRLDYPPPRTTAINMCISTIRTAHKQINLPACVAELSNACVLASKSCRKHLIVQHDYHDHGSEPVPSGTAAQHVLEDNGMNHNAFPLKLYEMLSLVERDGFSGVVSWQPHGRCFVVHKPDEFKTILPRYFKLSKVASFQRQLNLYGFMRLTRGLDKGGYYHELFLQGKPWLAQKIQRVKVKGTGVRAKSNPAQEPDFWSMPWTTSNGKADSTVKSPPTEVLPAAPPVTSSTAPLSSTSQQQHVVDDCTRSVVSQDEEVPSPQLPQHEVAPQPVQSVEPASAYFVGEPREDSLVSSWGMPFYYLSRPASPHFPAVVSLPSIDDDMDKILGDMDIDQVMQELLGNAKGHSFADLLERAAQ